MPGAGGPKPGLPGLPGLGGGKPGGMPGGLPGGLPGLGGLPSFNPFGKKK
jgi:suppressor of tumorigenicity protein 13